MLNTKYTEVSPVLSVLAAQGGRVTGKTAKERPRRDRNKQNFDYYLRKAEDIEPFEEEQTPLL